MSLPSQEYLQSRIDYNPETGEARWKLVDESYGRMWKRFNNNSAGKLLSKNVKLDKSTYSTARLLYKLIHGKEVVKVTYINKNNSDYRLANLSEKIYKPVANIRDAGALPEVHKYLEYYHTKGVLVWLSRDHNNTFNKQFAGKIAGYARVGYKGGTGYVVVGINNKHYQSHRIAWYLYYGVDPIEYHIDHIDGDRSNNCITNLRLATRSFNIQQSRKGATGINLVGNRWHCKITINNKPLFLGVYDTPEEAHAAYNSAVQKYKPTYKFTDEEQALLDDLYNTYPNCSSDLQRACHALQVKAIKYYDDAAVVQTPNLEYNSSS